MEITTATPHDERIWNEFIQTNYPPVGSFMASFEWGTFQEALGRKVSRHFIHDKGTIIAAFTLVHYPMRFGFHYGYLPRGPVITANALEKIGAAAIMGAIGAWIKKHYPQFLFVRFEPPIESIEKRALRKAHLIRKPYYVQPRYNHTIPLTDEDIKARFHSSTRSNLARAERRGVTVTVQENVSEEELGSFFAMMDDTTKRNGSKPVYPGAHYFRSMLQIIPAFSAEHSSRLSLSLFLGHVHGAPAAIHLVVYFALTATYLFGASFTDSLNSKVTTYLHWFAMEDGKKRGLTHYDLGGVDEKRWPSLTTFKRQYHGEETKYIGNIDYPVRPLLYRLYDCFRRLRGL